MIQVDLMRFSALSNLSPDFETGARATYECTAKGDSELQY